jgi:hypothetical protein
VQVRTRITAQPFRTFHVHLAGGRTFEIRHPENIACSEDGREAAIFAEGEMHLVDMLHIDVLERAPAAADKKPEGNGG